MRSLTALVTFVLFFFALTFVSCSYKQRQLLFEHEATITDTARSPASVTGAGTSDYRIQSQDILQIKNLQNAKYIVDETPTAVSPATGGGGLGNSGSTSAGEGQSYQVEDDGTVALPLIGHIHVAGLTRAEAQKKVEDIYSKETSIFL